MTLIVKKKCGSNPKIKTRKALYIIREVRMSEPGHNANVESTGFLRYRRRRYETSIISIIR